MNPEPLDKPLSFPRSTGITAGGGLAGQNIHAIDTEHSLSQDGSRGPREEFPTCLRVFAETFGAVHLRDAVRAACDTLRREVNEHIPPIGLRRVLGRYNAELRVKPIATPGRLDVRDGRYVVTVKEGMAWRRQRFTVAHEIGHIILIETLARVAPGLLVELRRPEVWETVERVCNWAAAELLMPLGDVVETLRRTGFTTNAIQVLYDRYLTSRTTLLIRLTEAFPSSSVVLWGSFARHGKEAVTLRVRRCFRGARGPWFPEGLTTKHLNPNPLEPPLSGQLDLPHTVCFDLGRQRTDLKGLAAAVPPPRFGSGTLPSFEGLFVQDEPGITADILLFAAEAGFGEVTPPSTSHHSCKKSNSTD